MWSLGLHAYAHCNGVTFAQVNGASHLEATVKEAAYTTLAVGVVCKQTVAHITVTPHSGTTDSSGYEAVTAAFVLAVLCVCVEFLYIDVVVIAEAVTYIDTLVGMVQVILHAWIGVWICTNGIGIDIVKILAPQQVVHCLIVIARVCIQLDTGTQLGGLVDIPVEVAGQAQGHLVIVTVLDIVDGVAFALVELCVGKVQVVKLDLAGVGPAGPVVVSIAPGNIIFVACTCIPYVIIV